MPSRSLDVLIQTFRELVESPLSRFSSVEIGVLIYRTLRSLREQAILYRMGRPWSRIAAKIELSRSYESSIQRNSKQEV